MSEEQWKPVHNRRESRSLIIFAIIIIAILSILLFFVADPGWHEPPQKPHAYNIEHDDIQNAVTGYAVDHDEALPILNGTYTNTDCSNCSVIDISALLIANGGLLTDVPDSCNLSISGNDNCGGNVDLGCSKEGSYIWLTDIYGNVYSYCAGVECTTNNSGYQGVWP